MATKCSYADSCYQETIQLYLGAVINAIKQSTSLLDTKTDQIDTEKQNQNLELSEYEGKITGIYSKPLEYLRISNPN